MDAERLQKLSDAVKAAAAREQATMSALSEVESRRHEAEAKYLEAKAALLWAQKELLDYVKGNG